MYTKDIYGVRRSEFEWNRVSAFFGGVLAAALLILLQPSRYLPVPVAALFASVPVALWYYGLSEKSLQTTSRVAFIVGIGLGLSLYLQDAGIV